MQTPDDTLRERFENQARMLADRVRKRFKHLRRRFSKGQIDVFRLYDTDIPEIRAVVDWYAGHLVVGEYARRQSVPEWLPLMGAAAAEALGVDARVLLAASSPIDGYILARFSRLKSLRPKDLFYRFMKELGRDMITLMGHKKQRLARLRKEARIVRVKHLKAVVSTIAETPKLSMELYLRELDDDRIVMCITPSVRGPGWELLRLGDSAMVDFRVIGHLPQMRFVHANGYVATTRTLLPLPRVIDLAARCLTALA